MKRLTENNITDSAPTKGADGNLYRVRTIENGGRHVLSIRRKVPGKRGWKIVLYNIGWDEIVAKFYQFVDGELTHD
jgi:hypothetical protein